MPFSKWSLNYWWFLSWKIIQNFPDLILIRSSSCYQFSLSMKGYQDVLLMIFLSCDISVTPPLPALSPSQSANQTPQSSPDFRLKYKLNQSGNNKPDLLENENLKKFQVSRVREGEGRGWVRVRWGDDAITMIFWGQGSDLGFYYYYHSISSSSQTVRPSFLGNTLLVDQLRGWEVSVWVWLVVMRWTTSSVSPALPCISLVELNHSNSARISWSAGQAGGVWWWCVGWS